MKKKANEQPQSPSNRPEHKRKFEVTAEAHLPGRGRFSIAKFPVLWSRSGSGSEEMGL
jgi:hypothetical protein